MPAIPVQGEWHEIVCPSPLYGHKIILDRPAADAIEVCSGSQCNGYRGLQTKTRSGKTCQAWISNSPNSEAKVLKDDAANVSDGLDSNYCRNPDAKTTIYCYLADESGFEYCDPIGS